MASLPCGGSQEVGLLSSPPDAPPRAQNNTTYSKKKKKRDRKKKALHVIWLSEWQASAKRFRLGETKYWISVSCPYIRRITVGGK
jgi:hypothetical protein